MEQVCIIDEQYDWEPALDHKKYPNQETYLSRPLHVVRNIKSLCRIRVMPAKYREDFGCYEKLKSHRARLRRIIVYRMKQNGLSFYDISQCLHLHKTRIYQMYNDEHKIRMRKWQNLDY